MTSGSWCLGMIEIRRVEPLESECDNAARVAWLMGDLGGSGRGSVGAVVRSGKGDNGRSDVAREGDEGAGGRPDGGAVGKLERILDREELCLSPIKAVAPLYRARVEMSRVWRMLVILARDPSVTVVAVDARPMAAISIGEGIWVECRTETLAGRWILRGGGDTTSDDRGLGRLGLIGLDETGLIGREGLPMSRCELRRGSVTMVSGRSITIETRWLLAVDEEPCR